MYTLKALAKHNVDFIDSFIDLKVEGWKAYEKAANAYTYGFYADTLKKQSEEVEKFAKFVKEANKKTLESI